MEQRYRYDRVAIGLHWVTASLILANLAIGLTFPIDTPGQPPSHRSLLHLHISIGLFVMLLTLFRLGWRLGHRPPSYDFVLPRWEHLLAKTGHWAFYALILLMPLTGWMTISAHKLQRMPLKMFGLPWPHFPIFPQLPAALVPKLHDLLVTIHTVLTEWLLLALLAVHVAAIIKHHLDRRPVLGRMFPG